MCTVQDWIRAEREAKRELALETDKEYVLFFYVGATNAKMYLHEIRGAVYLSWVSEKDREHALLFPTHERAVEFAKMLKQMASETLRGEEK